MLSVVELCRALLAAGDATSMASILDNKTSLHTHETLRRLLLHLQLLASCSTDNKV